MAPGLQGFLNPSMSVGLIDGGRARRTSSSSVEDTSPDEFAMLEETFQDSEIHAGEEVELFASQLDDCITANGASTERRANLFRLVDTYYAYADERASVLRERQRLEKAARAGSWAVVQSDDNSGGENDHDMDLDESRPMHPATDLVRWEEEAQTWDLLRRLLPLRYRDKAAPQSVEKAEIQPQSRREYWADFLLSEPKAREKKTILEWLQTSATTRPDIDDIVKDLLQSADRGDIVTHGWLHTRGAIKQHKRLVARSDPLPPNSRELVDSNLETARKLVTQLDPDVVARQKDRKLAVQDEFFEKSIWRGCYELLRRGCSMTDIRDWCQERTEVWRAATFSGLPLSEGDDEEVPNFDPFSTLLWRRMCSKLAQDGGIADQFERAVYGILSGDVSVVDQVCTTWDDLAFSKYNAELRSHFDSYLAKQCDGDAIGSLSILHGEVRPHLESREREERSRKLASRPSKALQAAILDDKLDSFFYQQGLVLAEHANKDRVSRLIPPAFGSATVKTEDRSKFIKSAEHHELRILVHVYIIITALNQLDGKNATNPGLLAPRYEVEEHAIAMYTGFLRLAHQEEIIPLYSSRLVGDRRYTNLSRNLMPIHSRNRQLDMLRLIDKLGLDTATFVKMQPQLHLSEILAADRSPKELKFSILKKDAPKLKYGREILPGIFGLESEPDEYFVTDANDELLIRSMEWLVLVPGMFVEACDFGVKIYKYFYKNLRLAAARVLSSRVSLAEIIKQRTNLGVEIQDEVDPTWWDDLFSTPRQDFDRMEDDSFGDFNLTREQVAIHARPLWELECLVSVLDCLETSTMIIQGQIRDPSRDREVAKAVDDNAKLLKGFMKPLLKGWLLQTDEGDPSSQHLREMYLPELVIAYASSLQFAGTTTSRDYLLECMELAAVIADQESDLAGILSQAKRLPELLESFASCGKALAIWTSDQKKGSGSSKKLREMGWSRDLWSIPAPSR